MHEPSGTVDPHDRAIVVELLARYADAIDRGDFDAVGALLSDATLRDAGGATVATGADEIAALFAATTRRFDDGTPATAHVITNAIVDPLPDGALELRSRFTVFQATDDVPLQPIAVGRYLDRVERRDGRWRIVDRTMIPERWGEVSDHLTFDPRTI